MGFPVSLFEEEVVLLQKYACKVLPHQIIIEIGTRNGGSALVMAAVTDCPIITIDVLPDPRHSDYMYDEIPPLPEHFASYGVADQIEQVTCHSRDYNHDGRPVGLVFIDGNHAEDVVRADWEEYSVLVEPGGYVLFHDSNMPTVKPVVDNLDVIEKVVSMSVVQV